MVKRKYENQGEESSKKLKKDKVANNDEEQNAVEDGTEEPSRVSGGYDVKHLRKELAAKQGQTMVLTQFLQVCLNPDSEVDYLLEYLKRSGNSHEILRQITTEGKKNLTLATPAFHLFHLIILKVQSSLPHMIAITEEACRYFLNNFMSTVEIMVSENSGPRHRKIVLKLLTSIVTLNSDLGIEVLNQAPLTSKHLHHIVEKSNSKEKDNVRTSFVHFMTSFLVDGHLLLIKALLEKQGLIDLVIPGLIHDEAEAVLMFLGILKKNVIDNALISKSLKLKTFNQKVLHNLFKIFSWKGPQELSVEARNEVKPEIMSLLSEILLTLFVNHKVGLYFVDNTLGTADLNKNPNLYKALSSLKRPWENETEQIVILNIVSKCPDLHRPLISVIEQSFEPQHSPIWERTVDFTIKLLDKMKPEDMVSRMSNLSPVQVANFVRFVTLPVPLLKTMQAEIGKDHTISLYCIKVLVKMLKTVRRYMQILEIDDSSAHISELKTRLEYFFPKHLPPPAIIVALIENVTNNKQKTDTSQDYKLPQISNTDGLISLVDLLLLYNDIHPSFFETIDGNVEMKQLLDYSLTLDDNNASVLKFKVVTLWLTLDNSAISLKNSMFKELFLILLDVYMSDDNSTWIEAKNTLKTFFKNTAIFDADEDEIHLILYTLRASRVSPPSLIGDIVHYTLENIDELSESVRNQSINFEISDENSSTSLEKLFDDLTNNRNTDDSVFLENRVPSPFVVGCMQYLFLNKDKKKNLKHFLSLYVANLLHSNYSPELTEVLIGDSKLDARNYVASWRGEPVSLPKAMVGTDTVLSNISKSIIDGENIPIKDVFPFVSEVTKDEGDIVVNNKGFKIDFEKYVDGSSLIIWAKYLVFCTVRLTDLNQLKQDQMDKITDYVDFIIKIGRKSHMIDVCRMIVLNLFKNPQVLKIYKVIDSSKSDSGLHATNFLLKIVVDHKDIVNHLNAKHKILKTYQQKNYNELVKAFVKINKRKNLDSAHTINALEVIGMSIEDDLRVFNQIFNVEVANCLKDDKEPSLVLELLQHLINKYSKTVGLDLQQQILRKCMKLYTEMLTSKEITPNLTCLEVTLAEYFENKPHQVKFVSEDLFKKFFEANTMRKSTSNLASVLLKHNVKFCSAFKDVVAKPELLSQRELTLPLGNAVITHNNFLIENKELLSKIYVEYKSNISKILEKPHKAGQVYVASSKFIRKLILECMEMSDCEKLFAKSHKFESLELSHLHLFQDVFYKLCTSEKLKKDHLINYFLSMLHVTSIALKEGKEQQVLIEVVRNIYSVVRLSKCINKFNVEQKEDFKKVVESAVWQNFCKAILKDSLKVRTAGQERSIEPQLLCLLTNLVKLFYGNEHDDICTLFDMVTSHSEFLNVMLSHHSTDIKSRLLEFLYTLILRNKSVMKTAQVPVYLSSYHASRRPCDRLILAILYHYETSGLPVNEYKPYVWGDSGANHYAIRKNRTSSLWGHPTPNQVMNLFDRDLLKRTVKNFPVTEKLEYHYELPSNIDDGEGLAMNEAFDRMISDGVFKATAVRDVEGSVKSLTLKSKYAQTIEDLKCKDVVSESHIEQDEGIYDPAFVLPLLGHLLAPGSAASSFKVMRSGLLALPLSALAARCAAARAAAYLVLHRFCMLLETETRHKNDKLFLNDFINTVRHSVAATANNTETDSIDNSDLKSPRMPAIDTLYLSRALMVSTAPSEPLYKPVNNFLIAKQSLDLTVVPDFLSLFHDSDVETAERRLWILNVIKDGTKTMTDVNVIFKTMCVKMIMDYYSSVLSDRKTKERILEVFEALVAVPRALDILVEGYGLMSWLHGVGRQIEKNEKSLFIGVLKVLRNMLYSMRLNSFARNVAMKTNANNGKITDFIELKVNKEVENEILVILYDISRNIDVLEVNEVAEYLTTYKNISRKTVKQLARNDIVSLVNKVGEICKDHDTVTILRKSLTSNDSNLLKSNILSKAESVCIKELTTIVKNYVC